MKQSEHAKTEAREQEAKRISRREQGWQQRHPLTTTPMKQAEVVNDTDRRMRRGKPVLHKWIPKY